MINLICTVCNKPYNVQPHKANKSKFCSRECFDQKTYQIPLTESEKQVVLTGVVGDGCLAKINPTARHYIYSTNSRFKVYIKFKQNFLTNLRYSKCCMGKNKGYTRNNIFQFHTQGHPEITAIALDSIENNLQKLTDLGIALWFYDDGSLHQKKHFYNLNTQAFSKKIQEELFIPFLKKRLGVMATLAQDKKLDGRHFYYIRINKNDGAEKISALLKRYYCPCFKYKIF